MNAEIVIDQKKAMVIGSEGIVGSRLLTYLSDHKAYSEIEAVTFYKKGIEIPKVNWRLTNMEELNFPPGDINDLFLCLDATYFSSSEKYHLAESQFRYFPRMIFRAYQSGIGQVMHLSGKRTDSDALFYLNRSRGVLEDLIKKMGFWSTHIFQPSFISGEPVGKSWTGRLASSLGEKVDQVTGNWVKKNKPVEADMVAKAMIAAAQRLESGVHFYSSEWLQNFSDSFLPKDVDKS